MPSRSSDKCRQCSKLSLEQALQQHGDLGTAAGMENHVTSAAPITHRGRYNRSRSLKYIGEKQSD